jgi:hypothetical protein
MVFDRLLVITVIIAYIKPRADTLRASLGEGTPIEKKKVIGFERVKLAAGASTTVSFALAPSHLAMVDADGNRALHRGKCTHAICWLLVMYEPSDRLLVVAGEFELVLSRGHEEELTAPAEVLPAVAGSAANTVQAFRKWW